MYINDIQCRCRAMKDDASASMVNLTACESNLSIVICCLCKVVDVCRWHI